MRRLTELLRGRPRVDPTELRAYGEAMRPLAERLGAIFSTWHHHLELDSGDDEQANSTSIQRWEAAALAERLQAIQPPEPLARTHVSLTGVMADTARATRLLANGHRFHSSRARCDGHALMLTAEERYESICRSLSNYGISVERAPFDDAPLGP